MKIDKPHISPQSSRPDSGAKVGTDKSVSVNQAPASGQGQDQVKLSAAARALQTMEAPFNTQKVAELKQAIADGRYVVDSDKIAKQIMAYSAFYREEKQ